MQNIFSCFYRRNTRGFFYPLSKSITILTIFILTNTLQINAQPCWDTVTTRYGHSLAIDSAHKLWAWGDNNEGVLAINPTYIAHLNTPYQIGNETDWKMVSSGATHALALKNDGTLWGWGRYGGSYGISYSPVQITSSNNWKYISAGWEFSAAIKNDGTLWTWGFNRHGQLGDGTTTEKLNPVQVGSDNDWKMVIAAYYCTLAIKNDGTLWAWGNNQFGCLGDGTFTTRFIPAQVGTSSDWKDISSNLDHCLALKTNGSMWGWGYNYYGQVGDGTTLTRNIPVQIGTDLTWKEVSAGSHSLALKANGTLWAWGHNLNGQLGNGSSGYTQYYVPSQIGVSSDWKYLIAGYHYSMGEKSDGSIWVWGWNSVGQLGTGNYTQLNTPQKLNCPITSVVPVKLITFTAQKQAVSILLNWETTNEINFNRFEIERSVNGFLFETIGSNAAISNSSVIKNYVFEDKNPGEGINYYRLKQFDINGSFEYSKTIAVNFDRKSSSIFPNPVTDYVTVKCSKKLKGIEILDISGREVLKMKISSNNVYNISSLSKGLYFVKLIEEDGSEFLKISKN